MNKNKKSMRRFNITSFLTITIIAIVLLSFLGSFHPMFDSISVFRQYFVIPLFILLPILFFSKRYVLFAINIFSIVICIISTFSISLFNYSIEDELEYSLYQKNLSFRMERYQPILDDFNEIAPDFITLQEVTNSHKYILRALKDKYPYQKYCDFAGVGGVAILSKLPFVEGTEKCFKGAALAKIEDKGKSFWLISTHLYWPWPYEQNSQLNNILPKLSSLHGDKIMAGDFNMVKWSSIINKINNALNTQSMRETNYTFLLEDIFPIAIDRVFIPKGSKSISFTRDFLGSDHMGLYAKISLPK